MSLLNLQLRLNGGLSFYKRQRTNFKILNVRTTLGNFLGNLTTPYNNVYAKELGASPVELGFLSSLGGAFAAALALPGGFLADRCGRKKLFLLGSAFGLLTPLSYFLARSWIWLVPAYAFSNIMIALRESAYQAMYASSVNPEDRGIAFGIGSMLTSLPVVLAPLAAVQLMGHPIRITATAIRPLYLIQLGGLIVLLLFTLFFLKEDGGPLRGFRSALGSRDLVFLAPFMAGPALLCLFLGWIKGVNPAALLSLLCLIAFAGGVLALGLWGYMRRPNGALREEVATILKFPGVKAWLAMKGIGAGAVGLANPFFLVYAAYVVGVSPAGLALMVSMRTMGHMVSAVPWGIAADRRGRKMTLLFGRSFLHLGVVCFLFGEEPWILILGYALMGVADGSSSVWTVIRMELVPAKSRSAIASMDAFVWYFPVIVSATIGGMLYAHSPELIFLLCLAIDAGIRMPLVAFGVPETSKADFYQEDKYTFGQ